MAMYHFTVKPDRKPSGQRIKAVDHSEYIDREGRYKDIDEERKKFTENFIHGLERKNVLDEDESALLYSSPYGEIKTNRKGLQVTDNPSAETLAIALMISKRALGDTVVVEGSSRFKARCIYAATLADLDIKFSDAEMQSVFEKKRKEMQDERERFIESGGQLRRRPRLPEPDPDKSGSTTLKALTEGRQAGLSSLSERHLDGSRQEDAPMLVQHDAGDELDVEGTSGSSSVRWDVRWGRRRVAEKAAKEILKNILKHQKEFVAMSHAKYIDREGAFEKKGGCVYRDCKLPSWAVDADGNPSPRVFFAAADRYSPPSRSRYREIEFALPNELTLEQNKELIDEFIKTNLPDHYYAYAVHDKIGALSDGTRNMHVHLMFSTKFIDDIEKTHERTKTNYFKDALRETTKNKTEKMLRQHGPQRDRRWDNRQFIREVRESFAEIQNKYLKKYGFDERVDHRSLKAQRDDAIRRGDMFLAKLLDRLPEQHIRTIALMEEGNPEAAGLKRLRHQKKIYLDLLYAATMAEQSAQEERMKDAEATVHSKADELKESSAYEEAGDEEGSLIHELKQDFIEALEEVDKWKPKVKYAAKAQEEAIRGFLDMKSREVWDRYYDLLELQKGWKEFLQEYELPKDATQKEKDAYQEMRAYLEEKMRSTQEKTKKLKPQIDEMVKKLTRNKDTNSRIKIRVNEILFEAKYANKAYQKANEHLKRATLALEDAIFDDAIREEKQDSFTAKELYVIMKRKYYGWKKEYEKLKKLRDAAEKEVISPARALYMAEDKYTGNATVELRKVLREVKKREGYLENDRVEAEKLRKEFSELPLPDPWKASELNAYNQKSKAVTDAEAKLQGTIDKIDELHAREAELRKTIDDYMKRPEAAEKIQEIADGILRGNLPKQQRYTKLVEKTKEAYNNMNHSKKQMNAMRKLAGMDSPKTRYRKEPHAAGGRGGGGGGGSGSGGGGGSPMNHPTPSMIADAIMGDPKLAPLVGRMEGEKNNGLDDWRFLSEVAKGDKNMEELMKEI